MLRLWVFWSSVVTMSFITYYALANNNPLFSAADHSPFRLFRNRNDDYAAATPRTKIVIRNSSPLFIMAHRMRARRLARSTPIRIFVRVAQYLIGLPKFTGPAFQRLEPICHFLQHTAALAAVHLGLLNQLIQNARRTGDFSVMEIIAVQRDG